MTHHHPASALAVEHVTHRYDEQRALDELSLDVHEGEIFALLGPNGSGKTTLFRLISTIARLQSGDIRVFGHSVKEQLADVRSSIGIVFQSPSLDRKLTVLENIQCQAALYGLQGAALRERIAEVTEQLGIADRLSAVVETLSGGLKRRVELAKGVLHRPQLLLLDEPSTGLDPAARLDLWHALEQLRREYGVTVLLTTHLLEEADKADRIAILHQGKCVALGAPTSLRAELGAQVLTIQTSARAEVLNWLNSRSAEAKEIDSQIRVTGGSTAQWIAPLSEAFSGQIQSLTLGQPSLEDVFVAKTGHKFW